MVKESRTSETRTAGSGKDNEKQTADNNEQIKKRRTKDSFTLSPHRNNISWESPGSCSQAR